MALMCDLFEPIDSWDVADSGGECSRDVSAQADLVEKAADRQSIKSLGNSRRKLKNKQGTRKDSKRSIISR